MSHELPDGFSDLPSLCRASEIAPVLRISKSTLWVMTAKGLFPRPLKISSRHTAWLRRDVEKWFLERLLVKHGRQV